VQTQIKTLKQAQHIFPNEKKSYYFKERYLGSFLNDLFLFKASKVSPLTLVSSRLFFLNGYFWAKRISVSKQTKTFKLGKVKVK
jgi:hypothetical protein